MNRILPSTKHLILLIVLFTVNNLFGQQFTQIEAAEYDPVYNRWLVSNGNSIIAQDALGELSFFGTTATANYGMEVMGNTLFAISGTNVRGYDLTTEEQVMSITISGAGFLNGMASDGLNRLWVTDFGSDRIYELDVSDLGNPVSNTVVPNTESTPNGIVHDPVNNRLVFVNWGNNADVKAVDLSDYSVSTLLSTNLGNIDGIDIDGTGNFYVSSWSPQRITKYNNDFSENETVTSSGLSNPADISYAQELDELGIANSGSEVLLIIPFTPTSLDNLSDQDSKLKLFPNPMVTNALLDVELENKAMVSIDIMDISGRRIKKVMTDRVLQGSNRVIIERGSLSPGYYSLVMSTENGTDTLPFVVSMD